MNAVKPVDTCLSKLYSPKISPKNAITIDSNYRFGEQFNMHGEIYSWINIQGNFYFLEKKKCFLSTYWAKNLEIIYFLFNVILGFFSCKFSILQYTFLQNFFARRKFLYSWYTTRNLKCIYGFGYVHYLCPITKTVIFITDFWILHQLI